MSKHLILSLDLQDHEKARSIINTTKEHLAMVKIGHMFIANCNLDYMKETFKNIDIMLDLKFFDIVNTVKSAIHAYTTNLINIKYFTFYGGMSEDTLKEIVKVEGAQGISVLILSSAEINETQFMKQASRNFSYGIRNFITPPAYIKSMRDNFGDQVTLFTPSVRSKNDKPNEHAEVYTPQQCITDLRTNYIIAGRPIINSSNIEKKILEYI